VAVKRKRLPVWTVRWVRVPDDVKMSYWRLEMGRRRYVDIHKCGVVGVARDRAELMRAGVSLRIYTRDGRIQEERTYPRSADPKRSRG
jgi:hypothetical protein